MSNWDESLQSAVGGFDADRKLIAAISAFGVEDVPPEAIGAAVRALWGNPEPGCRPRDIADAANWWQLRAQGIAVGMRDMDQCLHRFEQQFVERLRSDPEKQIRAGLLISADFSVRGVSPEGHFMVDPSGSPWSEVHERLENRWLVLGWPRNGSPRPWYLLEDARRFTAALEAARQNMLTEHRREERRLEAAWDAAEKTSTGGQLRAMRDRIAQLEADNRALRDQKTAA